MKWRAELYPTRTVAWSPEKIRKFWDYIASVPELQHTHFANQVGFGVVRLLSFAVELWQREVLDYGCGPGYLFPHLARKGAFVSGTDVSQRSLELANERYRGDKNWKEAKSMTARGAPWPADAFHIVVCAEMIEHVPEDEARHIFRDVFRLLKPGGHALFTTPNEERLEANMVYCPECDTTFHRRQHVQSWSASRLRRELTVSGLLVEFCETLNLWNFERPWRLPWQDMSARQLKGSLEYLYRLALDHLMPKPFPRQRILRSLMRNGARPHLVAIARKHGAGCPVRP